MKTIFSRIQEFNSNRVPEMVQIKYKLMAENMFRFYRGTCHLFYEDLCHTKQFPSSPDVWICGDLHLENFGSYKANNKLVYFDLNDFDEAVLAPALWEVTRLVTSIFIAFEILKIEPAKATKMAQLFIKSYSNTFINSKPYNIDPRTAKGIVQDFLVSASNRKKKQILKKRTIQKKDRLIIMMDDPRHFELDNFLKRELIHHINSWIMYSPDGPYNYEAIDAVFRLAGTGSVGLKRYAFLLKNLKEEADYMLIDMKQATTSSLHPYNNTKQPKWENDAERIVAIQQRMQHMAPGYLSRTIFKDEPYIIQVMQPVKDSINFNLIKDQYRDIYQVIDDMAVLTASSQLRSSGHQGSAIVDTLIRFGNDTTWQKDVLEYAIKYTEKVQKDYKAYLIDYKKEVKNSKGKK